MTPRLDKIISGGQTGADVGGLLAGESLGIPTGGTAPRYWTTEDGPAPWLGSRFGLVECRDPGYAPRTLLNVVDSDGTLIFGYDGSPGCRLTRRLCMQARTPLCYVPWSTGLLVDEAAVATMASWLVENEVRVLNVAGNRESINPGIMWACCHFLRCVLDGSPLPMRSVA